jgi:hypothetical protein
LLLLEPREMSLPRPHGYRDSLVRITLLVTLAVAVLFPAGLWLQRTLADRLIESRIDDMQRSFTRETARAMRRITLAETRATRLASRPASRLARVARGRRARCGAVRSRDATRPRRHAALGYAERAGARHALGS